MRPTERRTCAHASRAIHGVNNYNGRLITCRSRSIVTFQNTWAEKVSNARDASVTPRSKTPTAEGRRDRVRSVWLDRRTPF